MDSGSRQCVCQRWHGANKAQDHLWKHETVIGNNLMMGGEYDFFCGCTTPNIVHATPVAELALSTQGVKLWPMMTVMAYSLTCAKSIIVPEHNSIIRSAMAAICVSVLVSGNAASTVWMTEGIFSKTSL